MNIKLLLLVFHGINSSNSGIAKKIKAQVCAFKNLGINTSISYLTLDIDNRYNGRLIGDDILEEYKTKYGIDKRFQWLFKFNELLKYVKRENINVVYIRYTHFANPFFISFLKKLKKLEVKILIEMPTYPYDQEYLKVSFSQKIYLFIEKIYRRKLKNYVVRVITFSNAEIIFGIPTVRISNAVNIDEINVKTEKKLDNIIILLGVASISFWHGFDRIIEGLNEYYNQNKNVKYKVMFNIIGDTNYGESLKYKQLVDKYNLKDYVKFHGRKPVNELDEYFNQADFAIGCLGVHRKGITYIQSIKNREYCARGIPFIYSEIDSDFEDKEFILKVPADDSVINIQSIIDFVENLKIQPKKIRQYAIDNLTWEKQLKKVVDFLESLD